MPGQKYRVLLISDSYPPVLGGSEVEAQRVSAGMIRRGHTVKVLCSGGPPMPPVRHWVDDVGVSVEILTRTSRGKVKDLIFATEVAAAIIAGKGRYDVVYFLMQGLHLAFGMVAARLVGIPFVVKIAGSGVIPVMRRTRMGKYELDWMKSWKTPLMLLNPGMFLEAIDDGLSADQLVWMPNPVDLEQFRPRRSNEAEQWRAAHGISPDATAVIYVGRLSHEKGLRELFAGFMVAARTSPQAVLVLVGDGQMRPELEALAAQSGLPSHQIRFIGRVKPHEVPVCLRACDIFALTSPGEGFACALLEAMASGLPSVVSDIPANAQLVDDGVHGIITPFGDADRIGQAFQRLFQDPDARNAMGQAARQRAADNYATDKVVELYENLFARALSARS